MQPTRLTAHSRLRRIEGRHNPLVKQLRQAFAHAELTDTGDCAIEGLRIIEEAIRSGQRIWERVPLVGGGATHPILSLPPSRNVDANIHLATPTSNLRVGQGQAIGVRSPAAEGTGIFGNRHVSVKPLPMLTRIAR